MLDYDMISKVRARQTARNLLLYKWQAADGRASATREREAFPHFLPVSPGPALYMFMYCTAVQLHCENLR